MRGAGMEERKQGKQERRKEVNKQGPETENKSGSARRGRGGSKGETDERRLHGSMNKREYEQKDRNKKRK